MLWVTQFSSSSSTVSGSSSEGNSSDYTLFLRDNIVDGRSVFSMVPAPVNNTGLVHSQTQFLQNNKKSLGTFSYQRGGNDSPTAFWNRFAFQSFNFSSFFQFSINLLDTNISELMGWQSGTESELLVDLASYFEQV